MALQLIAGEIIAGAGTLMAKLTGGEVVNATSPTAALELIAGERVSKTQAAPPAPPTEIPTDATFTDWGGGTGGATWTNPNTTDTIKVQYYLNDTEFGAVVLLAANTTSDSRGGYGITDGGYFRVWYYNGDGDGPQATSNTVGF